jgi:hypothetical protein
MPVDPYWLESIPPPPPSAVFDDRALAERLDSGRQFLDARGLAELYPGFAWSLAIANEADQLRRIQAAYPFVERLSTGFAEPQIDERPPGLSVIVYASPPQDLLESGELHDAYLETEPVVSNGVEFPVLVRISSPELQVSLTSPSAAMLAAWTTVHRNTSPQSGWLTAFHAVGNKHARVMYDDGSRGRVVESFGECMDAVVASTSSGIPGGLSSISALDVLPIGLTLQVTDQHGTTLSPALTDVDVNIGLISYIKAPIRLTYDWATSAHGDSGGLVCDANSGQPVAMHLGASIMRDSKGNQKFDVFGNPIKRAFGLCMYQIQSGADGEFFL